VAKTETSGKQTIAKEIAVGGGACCVRIGSDAPLAFICGPCVIESREHALFMADKISAIAGKLGVPVVFKASYDKANRTSGAGFRGVGMERGLAILAEVRSNFGIPVVTDVHTEEEARQAGEVVDLVQIPAFLCRQTSLLGAAAATGKPVMVKKGQFVHPADMRHVVDKLVGSGATQVLLCERGSCFGYRELVVDFRSLAIMAEFGGPVVFDGTHSVQIMGGEQGCSGGNRKFVPALCRAAVSVGVDALFLECHDHPDSAPSDGPNMVELSCLSQLMAELAALHRSASDISGKRGR
jgi:2-dehydro-3-deoxyphosphooctonate aldolase (KDO 8-P synthase)